ncbi:hypothetical protein [Sulfitobacter sp.]|uniref:hypothetical protein n=1 Tax=Sulfitobacter sp. TaxID=1903071 RepID=UPI003003A2E0
MPATPEFWSNSFTVNNNIAEDATDPQVIKLANGNTLIAWVSADDSSPTTVNGLDLRGQLFDPLGNEVGVEFRLNRT